MSIYVRNNTASTIARGQAVYSDGTAGGLPRVALAKANAVGTMPCIGITLEPIDPSQDGRVGTLETVTAMDTSAFALGDLLYVSAATAGALTATVPASPNIVQRVGRVTFVSARDGRLSLNVETANFAKDGSWEIAGAAPELRFSETDQTDPAGRWRWRAQGDTLFLERALTAGWATFNAVLEVNVGVTQTILDGLDNTWSTSINGGGSGAYIIVGGRTANSGEQGGTEFYGLSAAFANKRRILLKGNTDAAYIELGNEAVSTGAADQALLRLSDGVSASLLAAHFYSSVTTGFWQPAANAMALVANAVERIRINATGIGFFATTPVAQQTGGANLTNNVTSGGTNDTIANYTDLITYANDAAAIRNDIYQLARSLKQDHDALRAYGLLT